MNSHHGTARLSMARAYTTGPGRGDTPARPRRLLARLRWPRPPPIALQRQGAVAREPDPLPLEDQPLELLVARAVGPRARAAPRVHDAVPGHARAVGQGVEGVA